MTKIFIQGAFTILGKILGSQEKSSVKVAVSDDNFVYIDILLKDNEIHSREEVEVSDGLVAAMESEEYGNLSQELESELSLLSSNTSLAVRKVIELIKYCYNQYEIDEGLMSSKGLSWSKDQKNWKRISRRLHIAVSTTSTIDFNKDSETWLQDYIDSNFQPFISLRHLHRARKESVPRHKWIEATIAAELAIKEFLIRRKPELSVLLLEVPSPPMYKMYGVVFREYTGMDLDKKILNALQKGAETRNRLLHRPQDEIIDHQQANDYVSAVSEAIRFLLTILYPKSHLAI